MPVIYSEGVSRGRIPLQTFVAAFSTNPARIFGLYPQKGTIAVGSDADIAVWDPRKEITVRYDMLHDASGYTPYEGMRLKGWPVLVVSRGRIAVENGELKLPRGSGAFLARDLSDAAMPLGSLEPEMDSATNFGTDVLTERLEP
jgi:dihydropyrimidinase